MATTTQHPAAEHHLAAAAHHAAASAFHNEKAHELTAHAPMHFVEHS